MKQSLLIVDDDLSLIEALSPYLAVEGFEFTHEHNGEQAIKQALNQKFDAIILDIVLPGCSGYEVIKAIRQHASTPILILTGRNDDVDKLVGFELGADDYLVKPCSPHEVIARLQVLIKRSTQILATKSIVEYDNIQLDSTKRLVHLNHEALELTNTEFTILEILIKTPGQAFSKEELTEYALGRKYTAYDRSIDVHISNLRNKLGNNSKNEAWIKTVRGFGYLFNA